MKCKLFRRGLSWEKIVKKTDPVLKKPTQMASPFKAATWALASPMSWAVSWAAVSWAVLSISASAWTKPYQTTKPQSAPKEILSLSLKNDSKPLLSTREAQTHTATSGSTKINDDNDPAWQLDPRLLDPRLLDRYAGKDSGPTARTQQASQAQQASTAKKPSAAGKSGGIEKASDLQKTCDTQFGMTQAQWLASPSGLNPTPRKVPLIVCLTSWPPRIQNLWLVIESLMRQTCKPDRIILCLALDEFPGGHVPLTLRLLQNRGLEIRFVPNWRSAKKLLPLKAEHESSILVTCDDDFWYKPQWLEELYKKHKKNPKAIWTGHEHIYYADKKGHLLPESCAMIGQLEPQWGRTIKGFLRAWFYGWKRLPPAILGGTGTLYPPRSLHPDVWNAEAFLRLSARNDDLWFYVMALRQRTPICVVHPLKPGVSLSQSQTILLPEKTQPHGLYMANMAFIRGPDGRRLLPIDRDLHTLFSRYGIYKLLNLRPIRHIDCVLK
jgi:hypothetical protein